MDCGREWISILAYGKNRGYAFVTYESREHAAAAVEALNDKELQEKKIRVSVKQTKHRLFLGNLDRHKTKKEVVAALLLVAPGLVRERARDDQNPNGTINFVRLRVQCTVRRWR